MRVPRARPTRVTAAATRRAAPKKPTTRAPPAPPADPATLALAADDAQATILESLANHPPPSTSQLSALRARAADADAALAAAVGSAAAPAYRVAAAAARARAAAAALAPHVPRAEGDADTIAAARLALATTGELLRLAQERVVGGSAADGVDWERAREKRVGG